MENTMNRCEDCPDWEEIYMSEMKKPEKGAKPKRITTKPQPKTREERVARDKAISGSSAFDNQSTDSNNK
jgi:hypothetical protein